MRNLLSGLLINLRKIFSGYYLLWHGLAILVTYSIVSFGFDWFYFVSTRAIGYTWLWIPGGLLGFLIPILVPLILYILGKYRNIERISITSIALAYSVILGWLISSFYKVFTGRIPPNLYNTIEDISHGFRFGFWEGGIFWGWPSSHTTVAFSMAITFLILFPEKRKTKILFMIYATYVGFSASIGFHWFSEFIAGIIFGTLVGVVVGKYFKNKLLPPTPHEAS